VLQGVRAQKQERGDGAGLAESTDEGRRSVRRMPVVSDASSTRRPMSWPRHASQGNSLGGHGRRQDHRLSWQVGAQVPSRLVPVLGPVTAQLHSCLIHRRADTSFVYTFFRYTRTDADSAISCRRERFQLQYCFVVIFTHISYIDFIRLYIFIANHSLSPSAVVVVRIYSRIIIYI